MGVFAPLMFQSGIASRHRLVLFRTDSVAERPPKSFGMDFNHVSGLDRDPGVAAQAAGTEIMNVHIARPTEPCIFEVVGFEIRQRVTHVVFARQHLALPDLRIPTLHQDRSGRERMEAGQDAVQDRSSMYAISSGRGEGSSPAP